ncbi:WYL domain-containing protein [Actinotignum urinale]|uniref:helix-turn-helix transcriptional regulator n=1 Tax=Actinotignum urinale TaxID=190146 RepID=UPI002A8287A9|nr:WYL domain-containing protein [Actinotignum urinale]MDY5128847.1 WYL domain-containing protein [Actinotignum urinale]
MAKTRNRGKITERHLSLLSFIRRGNGVTLADMYSQIPAYRDNNLSESTLERDIFALRQAGYPIRTTGKYTYVYDETAPLWAHVNRADASVLRSALSLVHKKDALHDAVVQGGKKLLSFVGEGTDAPLPLYTAYRSPEGSKYASIIARALQAGKRVQYAYRGSASVPSVYCLEPWHISSFLDSFYVTGMAVKVGASVPGSQQPSQAWELRTFKLSRMADLVVLEEDTCFPRRDVTLPIFQTEYADIAIAPGTCAPLRTRGVALSTTDENAATAVPLGTRGVSTHNVDVTTGWPVYRFSAVTLAHLWQNLMLYGDDVRLVAPNELREQWHSRLASLYACVSGRQGNPQLAGFEPQSAQSPEV